MPYKPEHLYYKYDNSFEPKYGRLWLYRKIIHHNGDGETCQVFEFERTSRDHYFKAGLAVPFIENIVTNRYRYYMDLGEPCTKEEFEHALAEFVENFNSYMKFIRCSP